ncbi:MAG: glutamate--tRNA ligase [Gammaproteobacteria bacterium]
MDVRTRFAPSPTGQLHVGNARTALFCALLAEQASGAFLLRIEDTDRQRSCAEFEAGLMADLTWLGLRWQEGPDVGGPRGPYRQSERDTIYRAQLDKLTAAGRTYPCFCTPLALAAARQAQLAAGQPPRYAGTCAQLSPHEVEARLAQGRKPAVRFRVPEGGTTVFDDLVRGRQSFAHRDIGDFVIQRADGSPAFFFSNAVDDALMDISHVLRGEDHLANTPRQILLLQALDLPVPRYGHLPLIVGAGGAPLAKREGGGSLVDLRAAGILPLALLNYLARLGHRYADNGLKSFAELARAFAIEHIGHAPAHYDPAQLEHWQRLAVRAAPAPELWAWLVMAAPELTESVPQDQRAAFLELTRENFSHPAQARTWAGILFGAALAPDETARAAASAAGRNFFEQALECFLSRPRDFREFSRAVGAQTGLSGRPLFAPLRAALTGVLHGPEMDRLWRFMAPALIEARLRTALATFSG